MAVNKLTTTTLSAALSKTVRLFQVGSTASIAVGDFLVVDWEMMEVQAIPASGWVEVQRGVGGSAPDEHASGATVFQGDQGEFGPKDAQGAFTVDGDSDRFPPYALPVGTRRRDALGNEYILCTPTTTVFGRMPVTIAENYDCTPLADTGRGRVGVVTEQATSDQLVWVQVYGRCLMQIGMSGVSPSDAANGPTTLSTSAQTRFMLATSVTTPASIGWTSQTSTAQYRVVGISVASDAAPGSVSAVTSAASHTGSEIAVFPNFPFIDYLRGDS